MNRSKYASFVLLIVLATTVAAQEWGIDSTLGLGITGALEADNQGPAANVSEKLGLWFDLPFGSSSGLEVKGSGSFTYSFTDATLKIVGDLNRLRYFTTLSGARSEPSWTFEIGRMGFEEISGHVLQANADGLRVSVETPNFDLIVAGGYTGFLLKDSSPLLLSKADIERYLDTNSYFGSNRALGQAVLALALAPNHTLNLSFTMQHDLNTLDGMAQSTGDNYQSSLGGSYDSQYTTIALEGLLAKGLVYNGSFTYQTGITFTDDGGGKAKANTIGAFAGGLGFDWYNPEVLGMALSLKGIYASGDGDASSTMEGNGAGDLTLFSPLTASGLSLAYSPTLSNVLVASLGASVKPLEGIDLQTGLDAFTYFRPVQGASGAPGISTDSASPYIGSGIDISVLYRIVEDLVVSFDGSVFIPGRGSSGAFPVDSSDLLYTFQASLKLEI